MSQDRYSKKLYDLLDNRQIEIERLKAALEMSQDRYSSAICGVVEWWDSLPPRLRQDIEGSGAEPSAIARCRNGRG